MNWIYLKNERTFVNMDFVTRVVFSGEYTYCVIVGSDSGNSIPLAGKDAEKVRKYLEIKANIETLI